VIFQVLLVSLIQYLLEMNGNVVFPDFEEKKWEVPAEHLLDFHDFIDRLEIVHEDVQIKLFKFSLEGIALDWCQSLPSASVSSLADFHAAFHVFCKDHFQLIFSILNVVMISIC
jgi:hypothetical protein